MIVIHNELHSNAAHPLIWINYDNVQAMPNIKGADIEVYLSCQQILPHVDRLVEAKSIQWSFDDYDYNEASLNQVLKMLPNIIKLSLKSDPTDGTIGDLVLNHHASIEYIRLSLSDNTSIPSWLTKVKRLKHLDLDNIDLDESFFEHFDYLETLSVTCTTLTQFPKNIGKCTQLQDLQLWYCDLTSLPNEIGDCKSLKIIHLNHNLLTRLPETFVQLQALECIDLSDNPDLDTEQVFRILAKLPKLRSVTINNIDVAKLPNPFQLRGLNYLSLSSTSFTEDHFIFAPCVTQATTLKIQGVVFKTIPFLADFPQLQVLELTNCALLKTLPDVFEQLPQLKSVIIKQTECLKKLPPSFYKSLSINELCFQSKGCALDIHRLKKMLNLKSLTYELSNIYEMEQLTALTGLESLTLTSSFPVTTLPTRFKKLKKLKYFNFALLNSIDVAQALAQLPFLETVELWDPIHLQKLVFPKGLKRLELNQSRFSPIHMIVNWIDQLPNLKQLKIHPAAATIITPNILKLNNLDIVDISNLESVIGEFPLEWVLLDRTKIRFSSSSMVLKFADKAVQRVAKMDLPSDALKMQAFGILGGFYQQLKLKNLLNYKSFENILLYALGTRTGDTPTDAIFTDDWEKATYIVLCKDVNEAALRPILLSGKPFVLEDDLKQRVLETTELPFLMSDSDMKLTDRITELLYSTASDNIELVVEMIGVGGANRRLLSYLTAIHKISKDETVQKRALFLFEQYASVSLQQHMNKDVRSIYIHPDIDYFDALSAEKMVRWHQGFISESDFSDIFIWNSGTWILEQEGLKRMFFANRIYLYNINETFDIQAFILLIKDLFITKLVFSNFSNSIDLEPLWTLPHLNSLFLTTRQKGLRLQIPAKLTAPLTHLQLEGFEWDDLHHLKPYLTQFTALTLNIVWNPDW